MAGEIDRAQLRERLPHLTDVARRLIVERIVEHMPDDVVRRLLDGVAPFEEQVDEQPQPTLRDRVRAHIDATRNGDYLGEYVTRNAHGQREPKQTAAWETTTLHLFDLAFEAIESRSDPYAREAATALAALVEEVESRCDELVAFEDRNATDEFHFQLETLQRLSTRRPT